VATISQEVKELLVKATRLNEEKTKLKQEAKALDEKVSALNVQIDKISTRVHNEIVMEDDMDTESLAIVLTGIGRIELAVEPYFNVLAANKRVLVDKFKESEDTRHLVKEDVHHSTLKAFCRETLREQGAYPYPELISVFNKPVLKFKKA